MIRRTRKYISVLLGSILAFGPCSAFASPSREKKVTYRPSKTAKSSTFKVARPLAARPQTSALRPGQTVTLLPDGTSLLIGGEEKGESLTTASITDLHSGVPVPLAVRLHYARAWHSATMLPDGRVLIVGGIGNNGRIVRSAEIFDPQTQSFSLLPNAEDAARAHHTATLLTNGTVLITGGSLGQGATSSRALLWDFRSGAFTVLSNKLSAARQKHRAFLLHDGNVLIDGGNGSDASDQTRVNELYNTEAGSFSFTSISADQADLREPFLSNSLPSNGAIEVPVAVFVGLLFSKRLRVETINSETLTLTGPEGDSQDKSRTRRKRKASFCYTDRVFASGCHLHNQCFGGN